MEGILSEVIQIKGVLSSTEVLTGYLSEKSESHPLVDSNGNHLIDSDENTLVDFQPANPLVGYIMDNPSVIAELSTTEEIHGNISSIETIAAEITVPTSIGSIPYTGEYEVTPSNVVQTLNTNGKTMRNNVTINPIPSNYGLITWNGGFLTIS